MNRFLQKGHTDGQLKHEQMLTITGYQENANQNHYGTSTYTCQNGYHQQINEQKVLAKMQRNGRHCVLLSRLHIGEATVENSMEISQKLKNRTVTRPSNSTSGYLSRHIPNTNSERCMHSLRSLKHYFQQPRYGSNLSAHQQMKGRGDVKHSVGNIVNNLAITIYGVRWRLDLSG